MSAWEWGLFPTAIGLGRPADGAGLRARLGAAGYRHGSIWGRWGIYKAGRLFAVVHIPSGAVLTCFDRLRIARRFCEAIDPLTDWSRPGEELRLDDDLGQLLHREALRLTGRRPEFQIIDGGRP
jgi:hypothetical protein